MQHCRMLFLCRGYAGLLLAICAWSLLISPALAGRTVYVATNGLSQYAYSNWTDAATNIQMAVNVANNSDTVMISNGTYYLASQIAIGSNIAVVSINTNPAEVFVNGNGMVHCFYLTASAVTLAGLTITNGYTTTANGGGVGVGSGSTILTNCVISGNVVTGSDSYYGGGVYGAAGTTVTIKQCLIAGNRQYRPSVYGTGGGIKGDGYIVIRDSTVRANYVNGDGAGVNLSGGGLVTNCLITANTAPQRGAGLFIGASTLATIANCQIISNSASSQGGGIWLQSLNFISGCRIIGNTSGSSGGGIYFSSTNSSVVNCEISSNTASSGGGVYFGATSPTSLVYCVIKQNTASSSAGAGLNVNASSGLGYEIARNCLIIGNSSAGSAGGVYMVSSGSLVSCTIAGNSGYGGGGMGGLRKGAPGAIIDCISYGNYASSGFDRTDFFNDSAAYTNDYYNNCAGVASSPVLNPAQGNKVANPQFVSSATGNYRLLANSPCINAGTNLPWMNGALDLDGRSRIDWFSRMVDMGAYEFLRSGAAVVLH